MRDLVETLAAMRSDVESILIDVNADFPNLHHQHCLSQGLRATVAVKAIKGLSLQERGKWYRQLQTLEDFLTLRDAVAILERE